MQDSPFVVTATTSSSLPVSFSTDTASICGLANPSWFAGVSSAQVTLNHTGRCILEAQQPGNSTFNPAATLSQFFDVKGEQVFLPLIEEK